METREMAQTTMTAFLNAESHIGANTGQETSSAQSSGTETTTTTPGTKCSKKKCTRIATGKFKTCEQCRKAVRESKQVMKKRKADAMEKNTKLKYCSNAGCMRTVEGEKFSTCKDCREIVQRSQAKQLSREPKEGCFVCQGCLDDKPIELKPDGSQYKNCKSCRETTQRSLAKGKIRDPKEGCFVCQHCLDDKPIELKPDGTQYRHCKKCREIVQRANDKRKTREPKKEGCFVCQGCRHEKPIELKSDGTQYKTCKPCREKAIKYDEEHLCEHGKPPRKCAECLTQDQIGEKMNLCDSCGKHVKGDRRKDRGGPGLCATCDTKSFQRIEHKVRDRLIQNGFEASSADDKLLGSKKHCPKVPVTRPDLSYVGQDRVLYVEVDEYEHRGYDVSCEQRKFCGAKWGLAEDLRVLPTILIRFNPHGGPFEDVLERLMEVVYKYRTNPIADLNLHPRHDLVTNAVYMFYTPTSKHIRNANEQASIHIAELVGESQKRPKKARVSAAD